MSKEFEKFEKERKKQQLSVLEYQKEARKKLIQNQYMLKSIIGKIKKSLENLPELSEDKRKKISERIEEIETNGEYQDILRIVEATKSDSFQDFKKLLYAQQQVGFL